MIIKQGKSYRELRCSYCRALLAFEYVVAGRVYIDCKRCGEGNTFTFRGAKAELEKYEYPTKQREEVSKDGRH